MITLIFAFPVRGQIPEDLSAGMRVKAKGIVINSSTIRAEEIEILLQKFGQDKVKGAILGVDPEARTITLSGLKIVATEDTRIENAADVSEFRPGHRLKAKGSYMDGELEAEMLKLKKDKSDKTDQLKLEGPVTQVDHSNNTIIVMGIKMMVTHQTKFEQERP